MANVDHVKSLANGATVFNFLARPKPDGVHRFECGDLARMDLKDSSILEEITSTTDIALYHV